MANTRVQRVIEQWVRDTWLRRNGEWQIVASQAHRYYEDPAVGAADPKKLSNFVGTYEVGKQGAGKIHKIRSDMLFLLLARARRRLALFTEPDMATFWRREQTKGRLPKQIEVVLVPLRDVMRVVLRKAQRRSSREVSPG